MGTAGFQDTIAAIATPSGEGGLGVIRVSGPKSREAVGSLWRGRSLTRFESHRLYLGTLQHPETHERLDTGLAVWMRAPHSFTGEDTVELQLHGSPLLLQRILELLIRQGLRLAEPGEFTRRAFMNGKMDLLQAEAVGEMIHARSEAALRNAHAQLTGRISQEIGEQRAGVLQLLARVEAAIDFPEEDIEILLPRETLAGIAALEAVLRQWLEKFSLGRLLREGVRLALVGKPNVGKSSLLNRLLGQDRAIVHDQAGTTRDVIEGWLSIEGIGFQIFDTAGIRESAEAVEREGMLRSQRVAAEADLTLWLLDASCPLSTEDQIVASHLTGKVLIVVNKIDLGLRWEALPRDWEISFLETAPRLEISAAEGQGIEVLKQAMLQQLALSDLPHSGEAYLNNVRHREALRSATQACARAREALAAKMPAECVAQDLREVAESLGVLLGEFRNEEVLDTIFSQFCIGK